MATYDMSLDMATTTHRIRAVDTRFNWKILTVLRRIQLDRISGFIYLPTIDAMAWALSTPSVKIEIWQR